MTRKRFTDYQTKPAHQVRNHETIRWAGIDYRIVSKVLHNGMVELVGVSVNPSKTAVTNAVVRRVPRDNLVLCLYDPDLRNPYYDPIDEHLWRPVIERLFDRYGHKATH